MTEQPREIFPFDNLLNFRDVGQTINQHTGRCILNSDKLFRAARPDFTSDSDRSKLVNSYGITTIIDLRSKTEHIEVAKQHHRIMSAASPEVLPVLDKTITKPVQMRGVAYREINLNGKGFERALVWQLKYVSLAKLILWMVLGYRVDAIAILGKEVLQPKGLIGLGTDTLDHSGPEIRDVFDVLTTESAYPVMVHCTQGKDRTGLIVLLVLLLCGISVDSITHDYAMSETELEPERAQRMKEIASIGLDKSFAGCPVDFCEKMKEHLKQRYGDVEKYLEGIGVDYAAQIRVREILLFRP